MLLECRIFRASVARRSTPNQRLGVLIEYRSVSRIAVILPKPPIRRAKASEYSKSCMPPLTISFIHRMIVIHNNCVVKTELLYYSVIIMNVLKTVQAVSGNCGSGGRHVHKRDLPNVRNLTVKRAQCDEIWAFCYAKDKNIPAEKQGQFGYGSVWTWTALDADSKLLISYAIGTRGMETARLFMNDLSSRVASRIQLTTDGHRVYADAV